MLFIIQQLAIIASKLMIRSSAVHNSWLNPEICLLSLTYRSCFAFAQSPQSSHFHPGVGWVQLCRHTGHGECLSHPLVSCWAAVRCEHEEVIQAIQHRSEHNIQTDDRTAVGKAYRLCFHCSITAVIQKCILFPPSTYPQTLHLAMLCKCSPRKLRTLKNYSHKKNDAKIT